MHEWLRRRLYEEREPGRELWHDFERTQRLTDPEPDDSEAEITAISDTRRSLCHRLRSSPPP